MNSRMVSLFAAACILYFPRSLTAITIYKDTTNPTGVPDVWQGATAHCEAAAWADGIWWFNQHRAGLVNTQAAGWYARSQTLFNNVATEIYTNGYGSPGVARYIHSKRPQDFSPATDAKLKAKRFIESTWGFEYANWKAVGGGAAADVHAAAEQSLNNQHRFSVLGVHLHETGTPPEQLVPVETFAHRMAYAGRTVNAAGSLTHLELSHGWDPSHEAEANPVSAAYYDHYTAEVAATAVANYHANQLRITDAGFHGSTRGGKTIDYATASSAATLRDDFKTFYGFGFFPQTAPAPAPENDSRGAFGATGAVDSRLVSRHVLENVGEGPIYEWAFELGLRHPESLGWLASVEFLELPDGWFAEYWDPNTTEYMSPMIFADELGQLPRGYRGLRLFTEINPLLDGESMALEFLIDGNEVDTSQFMAAFAIGDHHRHHFAESLGFSAVPEPASVALFAAGCAAMAIIRFVRRRRQT